MPGNVMSIVFVQDDSGQWFVREFRSGSLGRYYTRNGWSHVAYILVKWLDSDYSEMLADFSSSAYTIVGKIPKGNGEQIVFL